MNITTPGNVVKREIKILALINSSIEQRHRPPTIQEIGDELGWSSKATTSSHLQQMKDAGLIKSEPNRPRTLEVTDKGVKYFETWGGIIRDQTR